MPIIIDPATGARKFVADNSGGFSLRNNIATAPATTEAGEFAKGLRSGMEQVQGLGNSALAAGAAVVGADDFSEEQSRQANENFARSGVIGPRVTDFNTATESTENFTDFLKGGIGQAVPTMLTAIGGGVAGLGVKSLLKSGVSKTVAGAGGAFAATEGLEAGGIFSGLVNDPVARENKTLGELAGISFAGGAPAAALDTLPLMRAARKFGLGLSARRELTSKMKEFGKGVTSQALIEGSTEGAQTVIERATHNFVNKHFEILGEEGINEILGAATIGTAFGGITGGAAVTPGIIGSRMAELDRETQDGISQAEATFNKLRKIDDPEVQDYLDLMQDENIEDTEVQEDLDAMLKDLNLRRPKFSKNPTAITPDTTVLNRRTKPPIDDQTTEISSALDRVDRAAPRETLSLPIRQRVQEDTVKEAPETIEFDEAENELTISGSELFTTDKNSIIGDSKSNVAFTDHINAKGELTSGFNFAQDRIAVLEKENPNASFRAVPALKAFQERARQLSVNNELEGTQEAEVIRLAQDDNLRMRTLSKDKQVDSSTIETIEQVEQHLRGRVFIERENQPAALRSGEPEQLTADQIKNEQTVSEKESRARAFANIGQEIDTLSELDPSQAEFQRQAKDLETLDTTLKTGDPQKNTAAMEIFRGQGGELTGNVKVDNINIRNAVSEERFSVQQIFKDTELGGLVQRQTDLKKELDKRKQNAVIRKKSALSKEGKALFKKTSTPTRSDFRALRSADPSSRFLLYGKDESGEVVGIRPHSMIQKNFQKLFGGQGRSYDKTTVGAAFSSGMADLMINENISLIDESFASDTIVFTDASKHPFTIGEIGALSTERTLSQAKKGSEILLTRLKADAGRKQKPAYIAAVKARIKELTRSETAAKRAELYATSTVSKLIKLETDLQELVSKKVKAETAVVKVEEAMRKVIKTTPANTDYIQQRVHLSMLYGHKFAEADLLQYQFKTAQEFEVAKLQSAFSRVNFINEGDGPIKIAEFTKLVGDTRTAVETEMTDVTAEIKRLSQSSERFEFVMRTTRNHPETSMIAAEEQYDRIVKEQEYVLDELAADKQTLVSIVSRYKKEAKQLNDSSKRRTLTIQKQIDQHSTFFKKNAKQFAEIAPVVKEFAKLSARVRKLDEKIADKNGNRGFLLSEVRKLEDKINAPDLFITNILRKYSPELIAQVAADPNDYQSKQKTEFEELFGFEKDKGNVTHFANAAEISAYTRLQNEIIELENKLVEADLHPQTSFLPPVEVGQLKAKQLELKSFYVNRQSEPRPTTLDEQTKKHEGQKGQKGQARAQRNVLKPIVTAVRQIAGRIKTTAGVLSTEQAMEAFNMTRSQLLETNGMYFKGKIWVKETLSPTVMREVIAHELGHGIFENELRTAGVTIQNNIRKEFDAWRESVRGKSVHTVIQSKAAFATARKYITESKDRAVSSLSAEDQTYLLDFEEWFADQVAVYEGTKPTTLIGKFFAKIGNLIKKLMGRQTQSSVREFLDGIEQRNWVPSAISRGKRFFEYAKASKPITDDTLMSHLMKSAGNSMSDIETLSQMLPKIFTKADLSLLGRAFTQGNVRSQLFRLYPDAAKVALDESVSRTVAAGLIQWSHGELQVGPKVHSVYEKMAGKLATALNGKTDMQKQNAALDAIKQGKAVWGHITDLKLTRERTDAKRFKDVESIADFMSSIGDVFEKVFISANDRLYGTKNPALIKLAQMFHSRTGTRLTKQGYFQEKQRNVGRYLSSASNVLKPLSDEQKTQVLADLRSGNHTTNEAKGMRKIFNAMYAYATQNGVEIELRKNYVPRVWNKEEVAKRRPELEALLGQHGIKQPAKAVDKLLGMEEREIEEWLIEYNPTAPQAKQRTLGQVPDQVLADANFLSNDLEYLTVNYIEALVKKVEYTKRFGEGNEKIIEITKDAEKLGATNDDIELMHSYIQAMMGITGHETNAALAKMLGLKEPPVGQKINPVIQQVLSTVLVVRNLALLSLAMFTSLADPLGISVRSGSLTDTGVALKTGLSEIWNSVTGQQSEVHELANALGILESHMTNVALQWEYGGTYMAPWARKVNDEFFKWTGLTGLTRLTRSMALGASHSFIARHASNPNESSLRYLEELNLTPEEVWLTPDGKSVRILTFQERSQAAQHERDRDDKVRAAMNQFVDEAILRPNAAQRPIWASDPHYMLVFHLKAFMYSFHDRILRRAVTEMGAHNSVAPMVGLMMFIPALLFIDSLRDLIKHGGTPSYKKNWDITDYAFNSMERAGLFGIYQQGFDIRQAQQYGGTGAEALLGGVMFPFQLFTDPTELLPFQNLSTK
jgi:hypothetical protein